MTQVRNTAMKGKRRPLHPALARIRYRIQELRYPRRLSQTDRNIHYLYVEVFWAAIFSAVVSFNATYALRLGASNQLVGWLSSLPSLFAMFIMIPTARFLETKSNRAPWLNYSLLMGRLGFFGAALIPWVLRRYQAEAVVALFIIRTIPITFFNTGFSPLMADVIPEQSRARVFANRNIILSAVTAISTLLAGRWLDVASELEWATFPMNYQILYIVGSVAAVASAYFVSRIQAPPTKVIDRRVDPEAKRPPWREIRAAARAMLTEQQDFVRIVVNTLVFNLGAWLVMPLYMILFVRQLQATDGWIGLNTTLANLGVIAGYAIWRWGIERLGDHRTLLISIPLSASYPFLVSLFPNLNAILVWGILINLINPGVNLSHTNIFYRVCPEDRRASYMAVYSSAMNVGAFVCPMIGVALAEIMDIRQVLIIGGIIRLVGALMFHLLPLETGGQHAPITQSGVASSG